MDFTSYPAQELVFPNFLSLFFNNVFVFVPVKKDPFMNPYCSFSMSLSQQGKEECSSLDVMMKKNLLRFFSGTVTSVAQRVRCTRDCKVPPPRAYTRNDWSQRIIGKKCKRTISYIDWPTPASCPSSAKMRYAGPPLWSLDCGCSPSPSQT
jgi:hypothetical protein